MNNKNLGVKSYIANLMVSPKINTYETLRRIKGIEKCTKVCIWIALEIYVDYNGIPPTLFSPSFLILNDFSL